MERKSTRDSFSRLAYPCNQANEKKKIIHYIHMKTHVYNYIIDI